VNFDISHVYITETCYTWAPSGGDHFIHMWCHLLAATIAQITTSLRRPQFF